MLKRINIKYETRDSLTFFMPPPASCIRLPCVKCVCVEWSGGSRYRRGEGMGVSLTAVIVREEEGAEVEA